MKKRTLTGALVGAALTVAAAFGLYETQQGTDSYGGLTLTEAQGMKAAGVSVYVQALSASTAAGLVLPGDRIPSLRNANEAGLLIAGYALIDCDTDGAADMDFTRAGIPDDLWNKLLFVAVDVEERCDKYQGVVTALDRIAELGKPRVIYTSYNSWVSYLGNPPKPPGSLLWDAYWNNNPTINYESHPYGGWTVDEVIGKQWQGGSDAAGNLTLVAGQNVDRNTFRLALIPFQVHPPACLCPPPSPFGECDPVFGNCWLPPSKTGYWVFPDGHVYDPILDYHFPLPVR